MAEQVQATLDLMVEPLRDLQERNIFSPEEIHAIVDRRRRYEYLTRRTSQIRKEDFLRYIHDEMLLEKLRKLRLKQIRREEGRNHHQDGAERDERIASHIGDRHILQFIHQLWQRLFRRFRSDQSLYVQYAEFLKAENQQHRLSKLYGQALQIFPKNVGWWIEAASHEYFTAGSLQSARILLQRGIRINPKSSELWLQSFCLELHFVQKMTGRRVLLTKASVTGNDNNKDNDISCINDNSDSEKEKSPEYDSYHIARLVHDNAIKEIPDNLGMRLQFWEACQQFPQTKDLQRYIVLSIQRDCCRKDPKAWIAVATLQMHHDSNHEGSVGFKTGLDGTPLDDKATNEHAAASSEEEEEMSQPPPKKKRGDSSVVPCLGSGDLVVDLMRDATKQIPTTEMYAEALRLLNQYSITIKDPRGSSYCSKVIDELYTEASCMPQCSAEVVLEYGDYLCKSGRKKIAIDKLTNYAMRNKSHSGVWLKLVELNYNYNGNAIKAVSVLERALTLVPTTSVKEHMRLLLELLGAKLSLQDSRTWRTMERIILLAPACSEMEEVQKPIFGVSCIAEGCIQFLSHTIATANMKEIRRVYKAMLFSSSLLQNFLRKGEAVRSKELIEASLRAECRLSETPLERRKNIEKILDLAIKAFEGTSICEDYRQRLNEEVRFGEEVTVTPTLRNLAVPIIDALRDNIGSSMINELYHRYHVVVVKNMKRKTTFNWRDICGLYRNLSKNDKDSWCIERDENNKIDRPTDFLQPVVTEDRGYCSFLIQKDREAYNCTLNKSLPFVEFHGWYYEKALWFFFGRNSPGNDGLRGRTDHTDSVSHDGTFHWQLSGRKVWKIHPTRELVESTNDPELRMDTEVEIECCDGDIIILNTRLWFHQTTIPSQRFPSVSYARDFRFQSEDGDAILEGGMSNLDGLYATENIAEGTILFTEDDLPDCELHRSSNNANCLLVELENGKSAVVAKRDIASGEFFCVAESSDERDCSEFSDNMESDAESLGIDLSVLES